MTEQAGHPFANKASDGIAPRPDHECETCGVTQAEHPRPREMCSGALNVEGEHFPCDFYRNHDGWAHNNREAQAIWR